MMRKAPIGIRRKPTSSTTAEYDRSKKSKKGSPSRGDVPVGIPPTSWRLWIATTAINVMLFMMGMVKRQLLKSFSMGRAMLSLITLWKFSLSFQAATKLTAKTVQRSKKITPTSSPMGINTVLLKNQTGRACKWSMLVFSPCGVK